MYKKLLSDTVIYGAGAILPRLINFGLTPLYTSQIVTSEFSQFAQLYALVAFVNIVLTFGFETAYFRFSSDGNLSGKVFHTSFWFVFINAVSFLVVMYLLKIPLSNFFDYETHPEYLIWFAWIAFFDAICMVPFAFLRFTGKPIKYSAIKVFQGVFQTVLILLFFFWIPENIMQKVGLEEKVSYPFFANVIASLSGVLLLFPIISKVRFYFNYELFKKMFLYAYPIMLAGLAFVTNENLDKLLLRGMIDEDEAGAYAGCYKIAVLMTLFVTAYRLGVEPFFFKKMNDTDAKKTYADVMLYFVIFSGGVVVALLGNLGWVQDIFLRNSDYKAAMDIVPIIVIANLFFGVYYNLSTWYKVTDKTYVGTVISWMGAGLTIILNLVLIPIIGFMASAWTTLVAYTVMMVVSYFWGQKKYRIPYKSKKIMIYLIFIIGLGMLSYYVFDSNIIIGNLLLITYIAFVIFIEKSSLKLEKQRTNES
ncbi:MAG: lipopolysaccharide biosynthesis protein [Moheibacter sp.]